MSDYSTTLIVPGLHGSGAGHWQTWWQEKDRNALRVEQDDWDRPDLNIWGQKLLEAVDESHGDVWIVAHSFGCLASLHVAQQRGQCIKGLFLVAPADPDKFGVAARLPKTLAVPSIVVASRNDPWLNFNKAQRWAATLGSQFVDMGEAGHINIESGFGAWQGGFDLFGDFSRNTTTLEFA